MQTESLNTAPNIFQRVVHALDSIQFGNAKEREYMLENISMLTASGMTVLDVLSAVRQELHSRNMLRIIDTISADIERGSSLWKAFQKSRIFPDHTISLVRIGEESGKLSDNLKLIAIQETKEREFQSKIRSAMIYPVFVLTLTVIVGVAIAWFILPRLATVFAQLDVELPAITKGLIAAGTFLGEYGHIAIPIFIAVLTLIIYVVFFFSKTKFIGQSLLFASPGIQGLIREVELARFGYLLGTLLQAGIPVTQALDSLEKATVFPHYKKLYAHLQGSIADGNSFQKSFSSYKKAKKLIPMPIQQLVVAGEQSGNLSNTLLTISANFEAKTEQTTKNVSVVLEPILLVIVWLGVVAVALAVILPIYSLIGGLNTDPNANMEVQSSNIKEQTTATTFTATTTESVATTTQKSIVKQKATLRILETGLGYLNVRSEPSTAGTMVGRALPGEEYEYVGTEVGWYEIMLSATTTGWVYGDYVEIITAQ